MWTRLFFLSLSLPVLHLDSIAVKQRDMKNIFRDDICLHPEGKENERFRYELTSPFCFTSITQAGNFCRSGGFFSAFLLQTGISGEITWEDAMGSQWTGKSRECLGTWSQSNIVYIRAERPDTTLEKVLVLSGRCQSASYSYFCLWWKLSPCACRSKSPCGAVSSLDTSRFQTHLLNLCALSQGRK